MLWAYPHDTGWDLPVELSRVATPMEHCITVPLGAIDPTVVTLLEEKTFDQAPVGDRHLIHGIIETSHLRELVAKGQQLELSDPAITFPRLDVVSPLRDIFSVLGEHRAAIIVFDTGEREGDPYENIGLITISDLNRHAFRLVIYALMADLEAALARLIDSAFAEPWNWIRLLSEDHQAIVLGYWEISKRKEVDAGPIVGTTLTNLLTVAAKSKHVRTLLGFQTRTQVDNVIGGLPDLRNRVMHPVRPVVPSAAGVEEVRSLLDRAIDLTNRVLRAETSTFRLVDDDTK